jgi:hypothetical protein
MFKALNDLFIIICGPRQQLPLSQWTKVTSGSAIIMNSCTSKVKITTIDNVTQNLQKS